MEVSQKKSFSLLELCENDKWDIIIDSMRTVACAFVYFLL